MCIAEWFRRRAEEAPNRPFLTFLDQSWTRGEAHRRAERLAAVLVRSGVRRGDRVAYFGFDHPMLLVALFACARIGAIFTPLNFRLSEGELVDIVTDARVHTLISDSRHQHLVERQWRELGCAVHLPLDDLLELDRQAPAGSDDHGPPAGLDATDVALLMYTSGTTARPKGVMLTHRNIWMSNVTAILGNAFRADDIGLNCAPLFHAAALNTLTMPLLMAGGHLVLQPAFDEAAFLTDVARYRVTVSLLVPTMMMRISQHQSFQASDVSSMRLLMTGGAPVPKRILQTYNDRGILTNQGYGMTETTSAVVLLGAEHAIEKLGSCGRPTMLTDVKLVDARGTKITEPNIRGEICMRGPTVAAGYWNQPEETVAAFDSDGWVHSGDVAYFDEDGFYYICDRLKDMIISGGENVYAAEVESALYEHPSIAEIAVIGTNDDRWGERVTAIVALRRNCSIDLFELSAFAEARLARYKVPRVLHMIDALPRTSTGKVNKSELRRRFQ
ncbi:acyl-CoA synthetase [Sphingomonas oryzagri]